MPRCFIVQDEFRNIDGEWVRVHEGGWHYSTRIDENGHEVPDKKLHLNDSSPNEWEWFYELAQPHHNSWVEKHGVGNLRPLSPLPYGAEHPQQAYDTHPDHGRWLKDRTEQNGVR